MEKETDDFQFPRHKRKTILCKDPETCPFCQAGIPRQVVVQTNDLVTGEAVTFEISEKVYDKIMDKKGGEEW